MVDCKSYYSAHTENRPSLVESGVDSRTWVTDCTCDVCQHRRQDQSEKVNAIWARYEMIGDDELHTVTDHMHFLFPPHICAFVFKTRTWGEYIRTRKSASQPWHR
jgi:hypothetical protein